MSDLLSENTSDSKLKCQLIQLTVDVMTLKELLINARIEVPTVTVTGSGEDINVSVGSSQKSIFNASQYNNKRAEIMARDSTKRMFIDAGREGPYGQADVDYLYDAVKKGGAEGAAAQKILDEWYKKAIT